MTANFDASRRSKLIGIIAKLNLHRDLLPSVTKWHQAEDLLNEIDALNPSKDLPYHGTAHAHTTALNAYEGARQAGVNEAGQRLIIIAALFHDFGHTGNGPEKENIANAVAHFLIHQQGTLPPLDPHQIREIAILIEETAHPHSAPTSTLAAILQDADMMQTFEPDRDRFITGLRTETGKPLTDDEAFQFAATVTMNTRWGRERQAKFIGQYGPKPGLR